jgi:hypothetical protein
VALSLVEQLPGETRFVLGDTHYNAPEVRAGCLAREVPGGERKRTLPAHGPRSGGQAHLPQTASQLHRELQSEHFKAIFECHQAVPTKSLNDTARFALVAVFVYQLALLRRHEWNLDSNGGLKAFLRAA